MTTVPSAQLIAGFIFILCAAVTVAGAVIAALSGRIIRGVCGLALCSLGLAGLFYFLRSPFLALMEILIYIGAVCVTIVFVIMLAEPEEPRITDPPRIRWLWGGLGLLVCTAVCVGLARLSLGPVLHAPETPATSGSVRDIGIALLTRYSLAFELVSLVILVAILGALTIARAGRTKEE